MNPIPVLNPPQTPPPIQHPGAAPVPLDGGGGGTGVVDALGGILTGGLSDVVKGLTAPVTAIVAPVTAIGDAASTVGGIVTKAAHLDWRGVLLRLAMAGAGTFLVGAGAVVLFRGLIPNDALKAAKAAIPGASLIPT